MNLDHILTAILTVLVSVNFGYSIGRKSAEAERKQQLQSFVDRNMTSEIVLELLNANKAGQEIVIGGRQFRVTHRSHERN